MSKHHKILNQTALECHMELVSSTAAAVLSPDKIVKIEN